MTVRSKYSTNGVYKCQNFLDYLRNADFPELPIGPIGGMSGWIITFQPKIEDDDVYFYPFIFRPDKPNILFRYYFSYLKTAGGSKTNSLEVSGYFDSEYGLHGAFKNLLELFDGYLDDDHLSVEYGVQIEGVQGVDGIWRFNFRDKLFDCGKLKNMVTLKTTYNGRQLYCHKKLLGFHWDGSADRLLIEGKDLRHVERCLQIMHGVRLNLCTFGFHKLLYIAHRYRFPNVLHFCQYQLIRDVDSEVNIIGDIRRAIEYNSRHYLAHLLKKLDSCPSPNQYLKWIFTPVQLGVMSGDMMKMCCRYVFEKSTMKAGKFI